MSETELFIIDRMRRYPYSYYEIAYALHLFNNRMMVNAAIRLSREKKICLIITSEILYKKWSR